ncbi:hypothetical protein BXY66_1015 [Shimia isoporae]|uniref:Secreted protein n=1 Tax=Shimia isoporae TaxID=647720 RepID=A0A4R1NL47_9RHOB|nr:hypothetical protein [Shimia isoporae]TCL08974.1 hypothetical protein BXY66_1015 [Shimia isoporae]
MKRFIVLAVATTLVTAAPAVAQTWSSNAPVIGPVNKPEGLLIHPYPASANHCPQGLQPVTMGGVICCGEPTTSETYYNRAGGSSHGKSMSCPAGQKGCS